MKTYKVELSEIFFRCKPIRTPHCLLFGLPEFNCSVSFFSCHRRHNQRKVRNLLCWLPSCRHFSIFWYSLCTVNS